MRKTVVTFAALLSLSALAAACAPPVPYFAKDETFLRQSGERKPWRKIAVLPFSGDPAFRRVAAEWFAYQVRKHGLFDVMDPSLAEIELKKLGFSMGEADIGIEEARKAALALGVEGVVVGSVKLQPGSVFQPFQRAAGASIIDTATGKVVATSIQTGYFPQNVTVAVERVAEDVIPVLYAAAGKTWVSPRKQAPPKSGTESMPW